MNIKRRNSYQQGLKRKPAFPPKRTTIAPSILSSDFSCLLENVRLLERAGTTILHLDVMDGHFVPNITFGPCVVGSLRPYTKLFFDTHLMISDPLKYIDAFAEAGSDILTVHLEADGVKRVPLAKLFNRIRKLGKKVGVSINPGTPAARVYPFLRDVDMVLVMTVEPGFGKQKLIIPALKKIPLLKERIAAAGSSCVIEVDGGINGDTIRDVVHAGADILVCGSVLFKDKDIIKAYNNLNNIIDKI